MSNMENVANILRGHIEHGIGLLQAGHGLEAHKHFETSDTVQGLGRVSVHPGMMFAVTRLLEPADLVAAASEIARYSYTNNYSAEIGGWHNGHSGNNLFDLTDEDHYSPDLVKSFHQEAGIVAAEEWLHLLQNVTGAPVADIAHQEVDVAAYFVIHNISLSDDFLTRYPERAQWYTAAHPEHSVRLQQFSSELGRRALQ